MQECQSPSADVCQHFNFDFAFARRVAELAAPRVSGPAQMSARVNGRILAWVSGDGLNAAQCYHRKSGSERADSSATFNLSGRFWTYDPSANPTGFATVTQVAVVSKDGKSYHAEGYAQFFDLNSNPLGPSTLQYDDGNRLA